MKNRGYRRLGLALLLLVAGGLIMTIDEAAQHQAKLEQLDIDFPIGLRDQELERIEKRQRTFLKVPEATEEEEQEVSTQDPVLRALSVSDPDESLIVLELNALRHSKVGQTLLNCLSPQAQEKMAEFRETMGVDLLEDFDRVALQGESVTFSGHFENTNWSEAFGENVEGYGDRGKIFASLSEEELEQLQAEAEFHGEIASSPNYTAVWNNELVIFGRDRDSLQETIDIIEGREEMPHTALEEGSTYGEAYGKLSTDMLLKMLPPDMEHIAGLLEETIDGADIHLDAMNNIAMTAKLGRAEGAENLNDLSRSLGGSLALGLSAARMAGEEELTQLLEFAKISGRGDDIQLDLALPSDILDQHLAKICDNIRLQGTPSDIEEDYEADEDEDDEEDEDEDEEEYEDEDYEEVEYDEAEYLEAE